MIRELASDNPLLKYPTFYNAYPIRNEISYAGAVLSGGVSPYSGVVLDDCYGRIFDQKSQSLMAKYGQTHRLSYYVNDPALQIVDELRVPYRRVPVFQAESFDMIRRVHRELTIANPDYAMLLRGQTRTYRIERSKQECLFLYGQEQVNEPSFLSSHLRKDFDQYFLKCMWQSQANKLLRRVGHNIYSTVGPEAGKEALQELLQYSRSANLMMFALGIAQHYGLPSIGLDLTDRLDVACWFATRTITPDPTGKATIALAPFNADRIPTIFIFRCPKDAVFEYRRTKPKAMPIGRPDKQGAWFGHVGWGSASNQLGSYLACAFRITKGMQMEIDSGLDDELFPSATNDPTLDFFMRMRSASNFEGEAKRVLQGVYHT